MAREWQRGNRVTEAKGSQWIKSGSSKRVEVAEKWQWQKELTKFISYRRIAIRFRKRYNISASEICLCG